MKIDNHYHELQDRTTQKGDIDYPDDDQIELTDDELQERASYEARKHLEVSRNTVRAVE